MHGFIAFATEEIRILCKFGRLMVRNIDRRIEVTFPILNQDLKDELDMIFETQFSDNVKARVLTFIRRVYFCGT